MEHFHSEDGLRQLKTRLLAMAALVEERMQLAVQALVDRRAELADRVIVGDAEINELQIEIDDRCLTILALQNPKATDLRTVAAAMKINADLERIGDQAVNIAEHALKLVRLPVLKPLIDIPRMAEMAAAMTRDSLDAFAKRDAAMARRVLAQDDEVDALKDQLFRELLTYMMGDAGTIERALALLLVSRCLERIADHATNIAEDTIFMVEATDVRHGRENPAAAGGVVP
jgi:phosphate transport system protein